MEFDPFFINLLNKKVNLFIDNFLIRFFFECLDIVLIDQQLALRSLRQIYA